MSNDDRQWIDITPSTEDARFQRWTTPGTVLEGEWRGHAERGHFGPQGAISTPEGLVLFAMPCVLKEALSQAAVGDLVRITYTGDRFSKSGHSYKLFRVQKSIREAVQGTLRGFVRDVCASLEARKVIEGDYDPQGLPDDTADLASRMPDDDDLPF